MKNKKITDDKTGHLGGHLNITHIDVGALRHIKNKFNIKSMIDIGCGPGGQILVAKNIGIENAIGIDGFPGNHREKGVKIILHDFTVSKYDHNKNKYDLAWSCEFVEHVEERFIPNYLNSFRVCKYVAMTFAPEGKAGYHHVNCKDQKYWLDVMEEHGFLLDEATTEEMRKKSTMKNNFIREHGLFFKSD